MSLFNIFSETERRLIPLCFYPVYEKNGDFEEEDWENLNFEMENYFPEDLFVKTILMTKRLHEMGVYEEKEIVRFTIPKMLKALEIAGLLSEVSISLVDTVGVVFGENYAAWIYKGEREQGKEFFYKLPFQLMFYHSQREDNYFVCKTQKGLDLKQNKVVITNSEDKENIIKNTKRIKLSEKDMKELKSSFSVLFMYTKMQILLKMDKLGYTSFLEKIGEAFCPLEEKEEFISHVRQYFTLSADIEENEWAYEDLSFKKFLSVILRVSNYSISLGASYEEISKWIEEKTGIKVDIEKEYQNHIEFIKKVSDLLEEKDYYLYFMIEDESFAKTELLIGKDGGFVEAGSKFSYEIVRFSEDFASRYRKDILTESRIKEMAENFYKIIGRADIITKEMLVRLFFKSEDEEDDEEYSDKA